MSHLPVEFIVPGFLAIFIFPVASNFQNGVFAVISSGLLNAGAFIAGSVSFGLVNTPKFAFLWIVEAVFVVAFAVSGFFLRWKIRYFVFLGASVLLAIALYVTFAIATKKFFWPPSTVWLLVGALEVVLWKMLFPKNFSSNEAVSLGLGVWASQCVAEFWWSLNFEKLKTKENLFAFGWLPLPVLLCILHWVWAHRRKLLDLKIEAVKEGEQARLLSKGSPAV
jgi:hypothetical protein